MTGTATEGQTIQAVERSFDIIEYLRENGPATVTKVKNALDYSSSTAHIHLKTLEELGYVVHRDTEYDLGLRFLRDGISVRDEHRLYHVARPELEALADETGEGIVLGVEENGQRVVIDSAMASEAVTDKVPIGEFTNMHWTALGKALLTHKPRDVVGSTLDEYGMPVATENTITDKEQFFEELERTKDRGYAIEDEERKEKIRSVALPIRANDTTIGALSITGPITRLTQSRIESELIEALQESVNIIEVKYIYE